MLNIQNINIPTRPTEAEHERHEGALFVERFEDGGCRLRRIVEDLEASIFYGIAAPKSTPVEIIERLNREINAGLADPKTKARLADEGGIVLSGSPAEFGKLIADETEKWGKVIRAANIKVE